MSIWADPMTFAAVWQRAVEASPDAPFLTFEHPTRPDQANIKAASTGPSSPTSTSWTYGQFDAEVQRVASHLSKLGVSTGSSVHLALTNSPIFVATWLATIRLEAWIVPSDPMARVPELADHLRRTTPTVGFCSRERADVYREAVAESGIEMAIIEIDEGDCSFSRFPAGVLRPGGTGLPKDADQWPSPALADRAGVLFTSGTTGQPKGVEVTQANYAFAGFTMAEASGLTSEDRHIVVLPLFHANAQYYSFASAIWAGASVALMPTFSASQFLAQAARYQATIASLFAAPLRMILARGGPGKGVVLRHCWFAQNVTAEQHQTISQWFGCTPRQLYGMTETIAAVLTDRADQTCPESLGSVTPGCEVEVHDSHAEPAESELTGSIVVKGERGITLFAGYLSDPETTEESFQGDWFVTGDRGRRDSEGRFYFDGRRSDVLKVAGENVSTIEVQQVLAEHPDLLEVAVIGVPDPIRDEVPVAFVVAADPTNPPTEAGLISWCETHLAKAKRPREFTFLSALPRTSVGKIRTYALKQEATL